MLNQPTVTTDLLCKWPQKSSLIQISFAPVCAGRGATQIRPMAKLHKSNTLKASSAALLCCTEQLQSRGYPKVLRHQEHVHHSESSLHCRRLNKQFLLSAAPQTIPSSAAKQQQQLWGLFGALGPLSSRSAGVWQGRRGWHSLGGRSSWQRSSTGIPGGCLIQSVPPVDQGIPTEVCRTKALSKPSSSPSQSVLPTATSSLSFVDKKQGKKKDFHRKLIITFSPPPLIFWHKCIRYSLQI